MSSDSKITFYACLHNKKAHPDLDLGDVDLFFYKKPCQDLLPCLKKGCELKEIILKNQDFMQMSLEDLENLARRS